jgi:hypothetical protein
VSGGSRWKERLCGGAGSHSPSLVMQMAVGSVIVVGKGRIGLEMVDYQTGVAGWRGDRPGRLQTRDLVGRYSLQGLIGIPIACQSEHTSVGKSFLLVMGPGERPDGPVEASGRPGYVSGNSEVDLKVHRGRLP